MANPSIDYPSVLADLKSRRDRLTLLIEGIEQMLGELKPGQASTGQSGIPMVSPSRNGSDIYRKMTIKDAAIHFLSGGGGGGRKPTLDIVQGLQDGGVKSKSKNLYTTIYNTLVSEANREEGKIVRNDDKSWSLRAGE
jgi:hypothetical protein